MKEYTTDQLRNVALVGHQGAGKTSVGESLLFATGATTRMGKVEEGNTVADFDEDERSRGLSIYTALLPVEYKDHKLNIIDAPGYVDFQGEARNAIRVADAALVVVDAVSGPEVGTELSVDYAAEFSLPLLALINKMDRENANFASVLAALKTRFPDYRFVPVQLPIGSQADFSGVIDLLAMKAYPGQGKDAAEVPADLRDEAEEARLELMEAAAEADDALLEKYFESETLSEDEIRRGLLAAARAPQKKLVPVFVSSATHGIGMLPLLDALVSYVLPPSERAVAVQAERDGEVEMLEPPQTDEGPAVAYVFHSHTDKYGTLTYFRLFSGMIKGNDTLVNVDGGHEERFGALMTMRGDSQIPLEVVHAGDIAVVAKLRETHTGQTLASKGFNKFVTRPHFAEPVYAVAVHPRTQSDSAKMGEVLTDLTNADPTLRWRQDPALKQAILEGSGGTHIDIAVSRAERNGVSMDISVPKVPYLETITKQASAEYTHKKQTGGAGQFARVFMRVEPLDEGDSEFEFANEVFGGSISQQFVASTEKGVRQALENGVIAGYPVRYVKAIVYDGKMHPVDSKDIAFQIAGRGAFREAFAQAGPVLLEPIMSLRVIVPEENMGDIMGDFNSRRGRVLGMETEAGRSVVRAEVPLAEIQRYSNDLRSMTAGRGVFTSEFLRYERVPSHVQAEIIAKAEKAKEEE